MKKFLITNAVAIFVLFAVTAAACIVSKKTDVAALLAIVGFSAICILAKRKLPRKYASDIVPVWMGVTLAAVGIFEPLLMVFCVAPYIIVLNIVFLRELTIGLIQYQNRVSWVSTTKKKTCIAVISAFMNFLILYGLPRII